MVIIALPILATIICGEVWSTQPTKSSQCDCGKHTGFPSRQSPPTILSYQPLVRILASSCLLRSSNMMVWLRGCVVPGGGGAAAGRGVNEERSSKEGGEAGS